MSAKTTQPSASVAKFHSLIVEALTEGPRQINKLYQLVLERQPQDCPNVCCPHRGRRGKSMEWQHEFQRQLARIAVNRDGLWHLKTAVPVTANPAAVAGEEMPTDTGEDEVPSSPFPVSYTGDPFIVTSEGLPGWARTEPHIMDMEEREKAPQDRFVVPNDFAEFYAWNPHYVLIWIKKRLNRFQIDDQVEDWTQELLVHLLSLPQGSTHRKRGANGRPEGCQDVIETFNPLLQYGASERRFRNYINRILGNRFLTVQSKRQNNSVLRPVNVSFGAGHGDKEYGGNNMVGEEFVHSNSQFLVDLTSKLAKQHDDRLYTNRFKQFVAETDPSVYPALEALESTGTIGEAAKFMNVSDGEFTRYRNRLKQLGECFENGTPVPKQRRQHKNRVKETKWSLSSRSRALGISWTPNCDEEESEITRRCV